MKLFGPKRLNANRVSIFLCGKFRRHLTTHSGSPNSRPCSPLIKRPSCCRCRRQLSTRGQVKGDSRAARNGWVSIFVFFATAFWLKSLTRDLLTMNDSNESEKVGERVRIFKRGATWHANYQFNSRQQRQSLNTDNKKTAIRKAIRLDRQLADGELPTKVEPATIADAITA